MKKYIIAVIKYRRYVGDHLKVIEGLEDEYPNYEFCQFINDYEVIMKLRNIRKEKLEKINNSDG